MRVVIVGGGGTGTELARMLVRSGEGEVVVVEAGAARCEELAAELDVLVLHGDGTHPELLQKAGLGPGCALVAATGSDALNTVVALLGHRLGVERIVVRLDDIGLRPACREIGVTEIVSPRLAAASRMLAATRGLAQLDLSLLARGGLRLTEASLNAWEGQRLSDCDMPAGCLPIAVTRGESVMLARPDFEPEPGDMLLALCESDAMQARLLKVLATDD